MEIPWQNFWQKVVERQMEIFNGRWAVTVVKIFNGDAAKIQHTMGRWLA